MNDYYSKKYNINKIESKSFKDINMKRILLEKWRKSNCAKRNNDQ